MTASASHRFRREDRLTRKRDIDWVFRGATRRATHGPLACLWVENSLNHARLGVLVAKRFVPLAVDRNRVKRVVREWFRLNKTACTPIDLIVRVRSYTPEEAAIKAALETILPDLRLEGTP